MIAKQVQAKEILKKIKAAGKILITSHTSPDMDAIGALLSCYHVLKQEGKKRAEAVLADAVPQELKFLPRSEEIKRKEISDLDLEEYDLLLFLDSASLHRVSQKNGFSTLPGGIFSVNIDHHKTNEQYASLNLVEEISSTSELLYNLFQQWGMKITKEIALCLLTGIMGDTGGFQYSGTTGDSFKIAGQLVDLGADPALVSYHTLRNVPLEKLHFWGLCLAKMKLGAAGEKKYVLSALSFAEIERFGGRGVKEGSESFFGQVKNTDFGVLITEQEKGVLSGSLRSRGSTDVSLLAVALGGGGHKGAAGFKFELENSSFQEGVGKVLLTIEKVINKK